MKTRDADALARLLEGEQPTNGGAGDDVRSLAALATAMEQRATAPRPEFREALRARLMAEATAPPAPTWVQRLRGAFDDGLARLRYSMRLATASAVAAATLSTGGVAAATQMSVPGDLLYPVKIAIEDARVDRADTVSERATLLLATAETRIGEAERALESDRPESAATAFDRADEAVREAAEVLLTAFLDTRDSQAYQPLLAFVSEHRPGLDALAPTLSGEPLRALDGLRTTFDRIEARIAALGEGCCPRAFSDSGATGGPQPGVGFDFARIPRADEPFDPCPCPPTRGASPAPADPPPAPDPADDEGDPAPAPDPGDDGDPPPPPPEPEPGEEPDDGPLPDPGDVLDDPIDAIDDAIDDILETLPGGDDATNSSSSDNPLREKLEGAVDDVGDTVDDLGDTVEDLGSTADDLGSTADDLGSTVDGTLP